VLHVAEILEFLTVSYIYIYIRRCCALKSTKFKILNYNFQSTIPSTTYIFRGSGSSVGIATDYGLDGPGSNPGGGEIFRPSRPALGLTQPPVKWGV